MKFFFTFVTAFVGMVVTLSANGITAKVISVIDGNTIEIESVENGKQKLVFAGVDSPELGQEFGQQAKRFLEKELLNKKVLVEFRGKDRWGNYLAIVLLDEDDIRVPLLKEGLAWTDEKKPDPDLEPYRIFAQKKGKGLWKNPEPTPPWVFRRQQSMERPKSS